MASTINASTSLGLVSTADTSGSIALQANGTTIATISSTGLTMNSGNIVQASTAAPSFAVNNNANQSVTANAETIAQFQTKQFDTAGAFNNTSSTATLNGLSVPAWAFMPPIAGYYTFSGTIRMQSCTGTNYGGFYKNGSRYNVGWYTDIAPSNGQIVSFSATLYLNGTTDYVQVFAALAGSGSQNINFNNASSSCLFSGGLIRSA